MSELQKRFSQVESEKMRESIKRVMMSYKHPWDFYSELIQNSADAIIDNFGYSEISSGTIELEIFPNERKIIIYDNGIGIKKSLKQKQMNPTNHNSNGMRITAERLEILNTAHRNKFFVQVSDLSDEQENVNGTKVVIQIPV